MPDSVIAQPAQPDSAPAWMPFPDLAPALAALDGECAVFDAAVQRVIGETAATLTALMDETAKAIKEVLDAAAVTKELDDEQTAAVLHGIRERASKGRPVGSDLTGHAGEVPR